jgi:hypothetical protein
LHPSEKVVRECVFDAGCGVPGATPS